MNFMKWSMLLWGHALAVQKKGLAGSLAGKPACCSDPEPADSA